MLVPILLGSESDREFAAKITGYLDGWGISHEVIVCSAHKVPEKLIGHIKRFNEMKDIVYVTIAGRSNGLSGCTAGSAVHPVIACPPFKDKDDMTVNINSTLQMPSDTPVMAILDPQNVALSIAKIFALKSSEMEEKVRSHIEAVKSKFA